MKKKLLSTCAILAFATTSNLVSAAAVEDNWYMTGSVGGFLTKNLEKDFKEEPIIKEKVPIKRKIGIAGFLGGGYKINENLRTDLTFFFAKPRYESLTKEKELTQAEQTGNLQDVKKAKLEYESDIKAFGLMVSGYVGFPVSDFAEIFIGPSVGYSRVLASSSSGETVTKTVTDANGQTSEKTEPKKETKGDLIGQNNFAWSISAGIGFNIEEVGKIDLQYRYIDFGKTGDKYKEEKYKDVKVEPSNIRGHVITVGIRKEF